MISHSGATAELMRLLPIVRPRVRTLVAVTRDPDSVLARGCTHWLDAGTGAYVGPLSDGGHNYTDEADSALPAPTSSVVSVCAVGDALALTLSRLKLGWSSDGKARRQDFLRCHPGGQLGIEVSAVGRAPERLNGREADTFRFSRTARTRRTRRRAQWCTVSSGKSRTSDTSLSLRLGRHRGVTERLARTRPHHSFQFPFHSFNSLEPSHTHTHARGRPRPLPLI